MHFNWPHNLHNLHHILELVNEIRKNPIRVLDSMLKRPMQS